MEAFLLTPTLLLAPAPAPSLLLLHPPLLAPASAFTLAFMPTGTPALGLLGVVTVLDLLFGLVFTLAAVLVCAAAAAAALVILAGAAAFCLLAPTPALAAAATLAPRMGARPEETQQCPSHVQRHT